MKKIAIITNPVKDPGYVHTKAVIKELKPRAAIVMEQALDDGVSLSSPEELCRDVDFALVLGGDGTMLRAARLSAPYGKPIVGVNFGHLGFLAQLEREDYIAAVDMLLEGGFEVDSRMMLNAEVMRGNACTAHFTALNDIVIARNSFSRMVAVHVFVDDDYLVSFQADGAVISTPTGSTAYSLSAGGPVVEPGMDVIILTPICPHDLHSRCIILSSERRVSVRIESAKNYAAALTVDGQEGYPLEPGDDIYISKSTFRTRLARIDNKSFYSVLRDKLAGRGINLYDCRTTD